MRAPASSCLFIRLSLDESWSYSGEDKWSWAISSSVLT